ncbi:MAG: hypothetical protein MHM6MM_004376 [Cercozoa sp. M6MM]
MDLVENEGVFVELAESDPVVFWQMALGVLSLKALAVLIFVLMRLGARKRREKIVRLTKKESKARAILSTSMSHIELEEAGSVTSGSFVSGSEALQMPREFVRSERPCGITFNNVEAWIPEANNDKHKDCDDDDVEDFDNIAGQPGRRTLLHPCSGSFAAGSMSLVLGESGAGKSTLMNAILGRLPRHRETGRRSRLQELLYGSSVLTTGHVVVGGADMTIRAQRQRVRNLVGYVPQYDVLFEELTVYENLKYAAMLRLPRSWSMERKLAIVDDVLDLLELRQVAATVVGNGVSKGGISGGQRKRVNIGVELVACPRVLVMDEPTSGLDAAVSHLLMCCLRALVNRFGVTLVAVVHQPRQEVFELFDSVTVLAHGGVMAYQGPLDQAVQYFADNFDFDMPPKEVNQANWLLDVVSARKSNIHESVVSKRGMQETWRHKSKSVAAPLSVQTDEEAPGDAVGSQTRRATIAETELESSARPSFLGQSQVVFRRAIAQTLAMPHAYAAGVVLVGFVGLINGTTEGSSYDLLEHAAFLNVHALACTALVGVAHGFLWAPDKLVVLRDNRAGLSPFAYFVGKQLADAVVYAWTLPLVFALCVYLYVWPNTTFLFYYAFVALAAFWGASVGQFCSVAFSHSIGAMLTCVITVSANLPFGGVLPYWRKMAFWQKAAGQVSLSHHFVNALFIEESHSFSHTGAASARAIIGYHTSEMWQHVTFPLLAALGVRLLTFMVLRQRARSKTHAVLV